VHLAPIFNCIKIGHLHIEVPSQLDPACSFTSMLPLLQPLLPISPNFLPSLMQPLFMKIVNSKNLQSHYAVWLQILP